MRIQGRRILMLLALCAVLTAFTSSNTVLSDLDRLTLYGKVKSMMVTRYTVSGKGKNMEKNMVLFQELTYFDIDGFETESAIFKDGKEYLTSRYEFNYLGRQSVSNQYLADGRLNLNIEYLYNSDTLRSEAIYHWSDDRIVEGICEEFDYRYDILVNELFSRVIYKYEYRGYCTGETYLKPDSSVSFNITSKYDFRGNQLESAYFRGNGGLAWMTKYTYDRYDHLIESRVFKDNRIAVKSTYTYQFDDKKNWLSRLENREVFVNILTAGLEQSDILTERIIEYY